MPSPQLEQVATQALQLNADERAELIERLVDSVVQPLHPAWEAELQRRLDDLEANPDDALPAEQVLQELRNALNTPHATQRD